jgi:hypothetical protein
MNAPDDAAAQWAEAGRWLAKADEDVAVAELSRRRSTASRPPRKSSKRCSSRQGWPLREAMTWSGWSSLRRRYTQP